jgi:hypothetical protein
MASANRPLMQAMASQQKTLDTQKRTLTAYAAHSRKLAHENNVLKLQLAYVARLAGVSKELDAIRRQADIDNPAQPVPNPASQPAAESTQEAMTPEAYDDPNAIGQTPGANQGVPAAATATPMDPGVTIPTEPYNNLQDVSAPVAGTETHVPDEQTRIETDVRVGDPMNPETAYPLNPAFGPTQQRGTTPPRDGEMSQTGSRNRMVASLRLARLQIAAGIATGEDLAVAAGIESNAGLSDEAMRAQIETLAAVTKAASRQGRGQGRAQGSQGLVPRAAAGSVRRTTPSLVTQPAPITSVAGSVGAVDPDAEDIFL